MLIRKITANWRRGSESNRRIKVLQTSPLPLGYRAIMGKSVSPHRRWANEGWAEMERETGFEPATSTLARSHSTTELLPPAWIHYCIAAKARSTKAAPSTRDDALQARYHSDESASTLECRCPESA